MKEFYKLENLQDLPQAPIPRIISENHVKRLSTLVENSKNLDDGTLVDQTGAISITDKTFPLTFITGLTPKNFSSHSIMKEEIFGPVLPILTVQTADEAVEVVDKVGPTPLTQYIFSSDKNSINVLSGVNAGNLLINDTMVGISYDGSLMRQ